MANGSRVEVVSVSCSSLMRSKDSAIAVEIASFLGGIGCQQEKPYKPSSSSWMTLWAP